jgi:hypothetical protein
MCDRKRACAQADAAKEHVGVLSLDIDGRHAQAVQYVKDEATREGFDLGTPGEVILFALLTVETLMAARASFDVVPLGGKGAGK